MTALAPGDSILRSSAPHVSTTPDQRTGVYPESRPPVLPPAYASRPPRIRPRPSLHTRRIISVRVGQVYSVERRASVLERVVSGGDRDRQHDDDGWKQRV
ncbi:hypothetical protein K466DRAFT_592926 [Polyporus arcularius HHB13444]|uniref:Uncharacterized protein n=1 Tax=Polyporus arcularius HHB13444 TaxID=1314778 RepID=A0A5C3NQ04_9APHY|nr:hypothetical protein K466DRAFT_592926 [Polyporus arcularius HHB13444]